MTAGKSNASVPKDPAGSHSPSEPVFLVVGRLRRAHGVRGEIQMDVLTDFPERIQPGVVLYAGLQRQALKVRSVRWHNKAMRTGSTSHPPNIAKVMAVATSSAADELNPLLSGSVLWTRPSKPSSR